MRLNSRKKQLQYGFRIFLSTVFLMQSFMVPSGLIKNNDENLHSNGFDTIQHQRLPLLYFGKSNLLTEMKEEWEDTGYYIRMVYEKGFWEFKKILKLDFYIPVLYISGCILLISLSPSTFRRTICKSMIALSMGGHAPPTFSSL